MNGEAVGQAPTLHPMIALLLTFAQTIRAAELFPVLIPETAPLTSSDPYAFLMATCLDRGTQAELIWTIPFDLRNLLGHLDPHKINELSLLEIRAVLTQLPRKPRYMRDAPRTIKELTALIVREYGGDASRIWSGKSASEVKRTLLRIHGVGPGIANMAVLLIEKGYAIRFADLDRRMIDVKPDVHVLRTMQRMGIVAAPIEREAVEAARKLNPEFPRKLDAPLWVIGRRWCHAQIPACSSCPMTAPCPKIGVAQ